MTLTRTAAAAAVWLGLAGCALDPAYRPPSESEELARRLVELERQVTKSRLEIERLQLRVADLETRPQAAEAPLAPPSGAVAGETLAGEGPLSAPPPRAAIEVAELAEESPQALDSGEPSYEAGLELLRDGRSEEAERVLRTFADAQPDSELADNAWFWIGESRLARHDLDGAVEAYRTTIERYPEGNKIPDALLKLGHALAERGERNAAREVWSELVERFPATAAAERAKGRLLEP